MRSRFLRLLTPVVFTARLSSGRLRPERERRGEEGRGVLKIYDPPVPPADSHSVSRAFALLRYSTHCAEPETDCVYVPVMRMIFSGALLMSRNWSPGLWSRHFNSLLRFTAHTALTQTVQGQHHHIERTGIIGHTLYTAKYCIYTANRL